MASKDARSSPPIAMRIVRPYGTEAELLDHEAAAFTRTGVVLIGAPSRPNGVVLRFEIALKDGSSLMRGEGRVVGYKPPMSNEEGALMLRFTRLDVKSKSLLDKAVAIREERRSLAPPAPKHAHAASQTAAATPPPPPVDPPPQAADRSMFGPASSPSPPAAQSFRPPLPSVAPVARPSTPAIPVPDDDPGEAEEVNDADIESAEETVLDPSAAAVAPVAASPLDQALDDLLSAPIARSVPPPPAPPENSLERAPARRLDPTTRASALDRLRARAKKLAEMPSYFPLGDRSSAAESTDVTKLAQEPGHTPVLGSFVAEREK